MIRRRSRIRELEAQLAVAIMQRDDAQRRLAAVQMQRLLDQPGIVDCSATTERRRHLEVVR